MLHPILLLFCTVLLLGLQLVHVAQAAPVLAAAGSTAADVSFHQPLSAPLLDNLLETACVEGDLQLALRMAKTMMMQQGGRGKAQAGLLHVLAALELVLHANDGEAVSLYRQAKSKDTNLVPPLGALHVEGKECGGLGDIFFVSAVILKQLATAQEEGTVATAGGSSSKGYEESALEGFTTLVTLCSDSGLHKEAESMLSRAIDLSSRLQTTTTTHKHASLLFRQCLLTPAVFESSAHLKEVREVLSRRIEALLAYTKAHASTTAQGGEGGMLLKNLDEFVLSPTFYFVYQGHNDKLLSSMLREAYALAHPPLEPVPDVSLSLPPPPPSSSSPTQKNKNNSNNKNSNDRIRVGFVSAHFRKHSICKLFCDVILGLDCK